MSKRRAGFDDYNGDGLDEFFLDGKYCTANTLTSAIPLPAPLGVRSLCLGGGM